MESATNQSKDANGLPPPLFYFGQCPPSLSQESSPTIPASSTTAVGKVRNNETLSQPFRQHPRHQPRKSSSGTSSKSNSVPNPGVSNSDKIVIVQTSSNNNNNNNNNNNKAFNQNKSQAKIPMKEKNQDEVNREFQRELLSAKSRLKSTYLGDSQESQESQEKEQEEPVQASVEGRPPPPPPPVLPGPGLVRTARPPPPPVRAMQSNNKKNVNINNNVNPREELMLAIRNKGGLGGLRKTGLSNL